MLHFAYLARPYAFLSPCEGAEFAALVVALDHALAAQEQMQLSAELIQAGCRYAVCAGHQCSTWDDSIDYAYLATDPDYNPPDARFVMTSWHEDQTLPEVARFFREHTSFDTFSPEQFIVVVVGGTEEQREGIVAAATEEFGAA